MYKSKFILVLMIALSLVWVTACSKTNGPVNSESPSGTAQQSTSSPETTPSDEPKEPEINMNGEKLTILTLAAPPQEDTPIGAMQLKRWKEVEKKYKVKIDWVQVPWGEAINMVTNAALSGDAVADFVMIDYYQAIPAIKQGLFMPLDDFFDFNDPKWPKKMKDWSYFNGHYYNVVDNYFNSSGLFYNKTMLQREGLPDPHDLVEKGEWTWETFLNLAKQVTKDTNSDGVTDQWAITSSLGPMLRTIVYSNGGSFIQEKDGKYVFAHDDAKTMEAIQFFSDLFNTHKVAAPPQGDPFDYVYYADAQTRFNTGKSAFVVGDIWEGSTRADMTDEQGFIYFPKGPQRTDSWQGSITNYGGFYMPASVQRAKEKAKIWEEMQLWDQVASSNRAAAENQLLADEKDIEVMLDSLNHTEVVYAMTGTEHDIFWNIANPIVTGGDSPETAIEKIRQTTQDAIDQVYNTAP
ncbi:ABC transporter substrate-binding protein [Paenibacillus sp. IITD108]|uniref:ABC transporter substrate-binding protein n=1 Tax=Paenibacillus sp. IITD108 TaxID=3116649 RepID=UPI002F413AE2